jgi:ribosomal protein S26
MWCWRRVKKISWTDHVRNEEVLLRVKEQRNILHEISKRKANCMVTFCVETAFYKGLLKARYKGDRSDRKTRKKSRKLLDDLKERRGYSYLKEETLDRTMWTARFGRDFGPVVRQTTK